MNSLFALILLIFSQSGYQMPPIGTIDFYGLRSVTEAQARQALRYKEGDTVPDSPVPSQLRLQAIPGVVKARLNFVCCKDGKAIMYVGIEEQGSQDIQFHPSPQGTAHLYDDVLQAGDAFDKAFSEALGLGEFAEDDVEGHSLMHYAPARAVQLQFIKLAALHEAQLHDVLRNSSDAHQRALAAQVLGYAADKKTVVDDLLYGMRDPNEIVRNNSTRALWPIAMLAQRSPDLGIKVPAEPFIDMLNSVVWTDRNKASLALLEITEKRDPAHFAELRARAMPALIEMARWKALPHAQAALYILGRMGGMTDADIQAALERGDRDAVIAAGVRGAKPS